MYGRFSIILGSLLVGLINIYFFSGVDNMKESQTLQAYTNVYFLALFIPLLSISGVIFIKFVQKQISTKI